MIVGSRSVVYPTLKINENWFVTGALQLATRPYFFDELTTQGYGAKGVVLQATLNYSRVSRKGSVLVRAGEMSSAFGSFLLHYDDADNALGTISPSLYGYYYSGSLNSWRCRSTGGRDARQVGRTGAICQLITRESSQPFCSRPIWQLGRRRRLHSATWGFRTSGFRDIAAPISISQYQYFFPGGKQIRIN